MRAFFITVILGLASAAPQYNYQEPGLNQQLGLPKITANLGDHSLLQDALQNRQLSQAILGPAPVANQLFNLQPAPFRPQQPINFDGGVLQQQFVPQIQYVRQGPQLQLQPQQFNFQAAPLAPVVTKDIYVHAAPEEPEEHFSAPPPPVLPPRKHYRIVFIKAPTQRVNTAALRLTQAPTEEKTIIYVLSKKPEPLDLQSIIQEAPRQPSKPEVYFIKYKTQEEAAHAQRSIQAQFDSLGGTSNVSDEGIAPVTSVIGSLQNQQQIIVPGLQQGVPGLATSGSSLSGNESPTYLPPSH